MKGIITLSVLGTCIFCGCAGVNIKPISSEEAENAHNGSKNQKVKGYIVYEPVIVVQIAKNITKESNGQEKIVYSAGAPFLLPDYTKPYVIEMNSGAAKSGMEYTIVDGWRLGSIKDNSDNTAVLGEIASIVSGVISMKNAQQLPKYDKCGLYRVNFNKETRKVELEPLFLYE